MKCRGLKEEKSDLIYPIFLDFKEYCLKNGKQRFKLEGFINYINSNDYMVVGYSWHQDERELEYENLGRVAISIFRVCECYANANASSYVINEKGEKTKLLKKLGPKTYEFIIE